jgi:hypothetical protein
MKNNNINKKKKKIRVEIEKLRTKVGSYKTLKFSIFYEEKLVYQNTDFKTINK